MTFMHTRLAYRAKYGCDISDMSTNCVTDARYGCDISDMSIEFVPTLQNQLPAAVASARTNTAPGVIQASLVLASPDSPSKAKTFSATPPVTKLFQI